jgi:hypothetical protein
VAYLGNTLQVAFPSYRNIDDISGSFNGVTTTFALRVSGAAPVPFPISSNQCLISVGGVVQRPDDSGTEGFRISGTNIIFSSAPSSGADFFGVILAGADYVNVGANFPSGSVTVPSITFDNDLDTGIYNPNANEIGFTTGGTARLIIDANGQVRTGGLGTAGNPVYTFNSDPNTGIYSPGSDQVAISTGGTGRLFIDSSGRLLVGTSSTSATLTAILQGSSDSATANAGLMLARGEAPGADGTVLGALDYAANNHVIASRILCKRDGGTWTAGTSQPTRLEFSTTADGTGTPTERMRITSVGRVGIGITSPAAQLDVAGGINSSSDFSLNSDSFIYSYKAGALGDVRSALRLDGTNRVVQFYTDASERVRIDSSGRVGIGTTGPGHALQVNGAICATGTFGTASASTVVLDVSGDARILTTGPSGGGYNPLAFAQVNSSGGGYTERARIDSSGRLLVGTSTSRGNNFSNLNQDMRFQVEGTDYLTSGASFTSNTNELDQGPHIVLNRSRGSTIGSNTIVQNNDNLGYIFFEGNDGARFVRGASIEARVDGTPGTNDMPCRLIFSTTADGALVPTRRIVVRNNGWVVFGQDTENSDIPGVGILGDIGGIYSTVSSNRCAWFNRQTSDGTLVDFQQDNATEGSISVSGTTVSYNGAHLSRWSQLPGGAERIEILRGTVLSNIDEMCQWDDEDNEQLNRMKVSDVEGDPNVSGVFQAWDNDDDTYTDDFYCAMTGDFIIRIAEGVTVQRGDLLMSAGDGTAKPQDDDIIRSKTIAKVTSTRVTCTYDDGSYCVPCVLMVC